MWVAYVVDSMGVNWVRRLDKDDFMLVGREQDRTLFSDRETPARLLTKFRQCLQQYGGEDLECQVVPFSQE